MGNITVFVLILVMVFVFPFLLGWGMFKSLKAKGNNKELRLFLLACSLGLVYFVYSAFYPTDGICIDKYERYTALYFPRSAQIIEKEASIINDIKGSFTDCYLIKMGHKAYLKTLDSIILQQKFKNHDSFLVYNSQYRKVEKKLGGQKYRHVFSDGSKAYIFLGFLDDGKSVLINIVGRQSALTDLPPVKDHSIIIAE